jgi:DNA end-binding protein Ku
MPRAIWKGVLRVGTLRLPVRFYSAVADRDVHFRLLHAKDKTPVRHQLVNPKTGAEVPFGAIRKGYQVRPDSMVVFTREELEALEPKDSRDVEVTRFVDADAVPHPFFERPYHLGPDGRGEGDYAALAAALSQTGKQGIVRWVMRDRAHAGALRASGAHLVVIELRQADEVISPADLQPPRAATPAAKELRLAEQLVSTLEEPFDPSRYRDEFRERALEYIKTKARGRKLKVIRPRPRRAPTSLTAALEASLQHGDKERKRA